MLTVEIRNIQEGTRSETTTLASSVTVGRHADCDLVVDSPFIGRRQLRLEIDEDGSVVVMDAHSPSGTWVDGTRLRGRHRLAPDEEVTFGQHVLMARSGLPPQLDFGPDVTTGSSRAPSDVNLERLRRLAEGGDVDASAQLWRVAQRRNDPELGLVAALAARPSRKTWHVIVDCLDALPLRPRGESRARLDRVETALQDWPDAICTAVPMWWTRLEAGHDDPRWRLVRTLELNPDAPDDLPLLLRTLLERKQPGLRILRIHRWHPEVDEMRRFLSSSNIGGLTRLELHHCRVGSAVHDMRRRRRPRPAPSAGALGVLLDSGFVGGLEGLGLRGCSVGDEDALRIARAESLRQLKWLDLSSNHITDRGAGSIARSPVLGSLDHLDLGNNPLGQIGIKALRTSVRVPQHALRFGP